MTNKTKLRLKRVVIKGTSGVVYNEKFHEGLNVIRGHNGTGKSTIMELISYGLGGDIKKNSWKREALACSNISIALSLNGKPYVFRRAIEGESSRPQIEILEGKFSDSIRKDAVWTCYKNSKTETRKSYSMQIFELLGMQQHNSADSESLTIHQLLRILYIDQDTPASKILRTEPFVYDKETMRRSIGEYAFGFDNLEAHALRQRLYDANKKFDKLDSELKTIYKILGQTNIKATSKEIEGEVSSLLRELDEISNGWIKSNVESNKVKVKAVNVKEEKIKAELATMLGLVARDEAEFISTVYEISESQAFIGTLEYRKRELEKANLASKSIGFLDFKYCPSCMVVVEKDIKNTGCCLCHDDSKQKNINETYIQALNELDFQITETQQILEEQSELKARLDASIRVNKESENRLRVALNEFKVFTSDYEIKLMEFSSQKGFIEAQIEHLKERQELASELDSKIQLKNRLQEEVNDCQLKLTKLEASRMKRVNSVKYKISRSVKFILSKDGGHEPAFDEAEKFEFDFSSDSMRLDDRANFSASSNVVLKNAFHLAVLLTAIDDDEFRIPCFSMFDNIEDKGMREERSQNFQRTITELTNAVDGKFQIIMTTSMVDETLNNDTYGVGPYYRKGEHTLNMLSDI